MTMDDDTRRVAELIRGNRLAMLTTVAPDGTLTSRPMGLQEADFDGDLWFFVERDSRKMVHVAHHPQVNVTVASGSTWVSLTGEAVEAEDRDRAHELWNAGVAAWFPDGPDDPAPASPEGRGHVGRVLGLARRSPGHRRQLREGEGDGRARLGRRERAGLAGVSAATG